MGVAAPPRAAGASPGTILFVVVAALAAVLFTQLRFELTGENHRASLPALVHGTADTPFQYRVLLPWLARQVLDFEPAARALGSPLNLFRIGECAATFVLFLVFRLYLGNFVAHPARRSVLALGLLPVLLFHFVLPREIPFWYPSDVPAVAFFTLGLHAIHRRRWTWFYPLFVIATANRETAVFLTLAMVVTGIGHDRPRTLAIHAAAQLLLWAGVKVWLWQMYADNPGAGLLELEADVDGRHHLLVNLAFLARPVNWPFLASAFGFLWIPCVLGWRHVTDPFVRGTLIVAAAYVAVSLVVGNVFELRMYGELAPIVMTGAYLALRGWLRA